MMNCSNKYWEKIQLKKIYMTTVFPVFAFTLFLFIWKCHMENRKPVDFKEIPEERWMEVDWGKEPAVEYDFFKDPNQKYIHVTFTDWAAAAVVNYSKKSGLEETEWELRRIYDRGDWNKIAAFVRSDTGRELYVYTNDENGLRYLLAADVKEGEGLTCMLGDGCYSYDSALEWITYETQPDQKGRAAQYSFTWSDNALIYDPVCLEESACAMEACLTAANAPGGSWELLEDELYVGVNGYLADVWYTNGVQKVHLFIDIWNKQYAVIEAVSSDGQENEFFLNVRLKSQVSPFKLPEEEWTKLDGAYKTESEYFNNAGEWHYAAEYEQLAAWAVNDYAERNGLEQETWFLRRMYMEDGSINAFVSSGNNRELYLLLDEKNKSYVVTVDWNIDGLPASGEKYQYSEDSRLVWHDYRKWYDSGQAEQSPDVSFHILCEDGCYEHNFWDGSVYALKDYLYSVAPDNRDTWSCIQNSFYMGKNRCIGDVWYDSGKKKIHMLVNMYNWEYTVLEVF